MDELLLEASGLQVTFKDSDFILRPMDLAIRRGETVSIVGESGSGKSTLLKALTCLSDEDARVEGRILLEGEDLLQLSKKELQKLRFAKFSVVFQNSREYLNPSLTLREMLRELLIRKYSGNELKEKTLEAIHRAGLGSEVLELYPRELSGGMVQKFQIACALALSPELIIFDEPTSSLDAASGKEFAAMVEKLKRENHTAVIIVTHDLALARELGGRMLVMYGGMVLEEGPARELLNAPGHPYTRALIGSAAELNLYKDIWGIREGEEAFGASACPFCSRCSQAIPQCREELPVLEEQGEDRRLACLRGGILQILSCRHMKKSYGKKEVLRDCSLDIRAGEIVSLIGRSGSGKTTLCSMIAGFRSGSGQVFFEEKAIDYEKAFRRKNGVQFVMQDHSDALNPHFTVYDAVREPLYLLGEKEAARGEVGAVLEKVGLPAGEDFLRRRIYSLSGGQRQRVCIARALIMEPALLIADEPTSMLDGSSKANLLRLLRNIQNENGFSMLVVTHDLSSALKISDRIFVLRGGMLEEAEKGCPAERLEEMLLTDKI